MNIKTKAIIITGTVSVVCLALFAGIVRWDQKILARKDRQFQERLAAEVIRFHVLAHSDSKEDQELKQKVRDGVLDYVRTLLSESDNKESAKIILEENFEPIRSVAKNILLANNCHYDVRVTLEETQFPEKTYDNYTFPAGNYDALRVFIGDAKGQNWWCVLFPSLCYTREGLKFTDTSKKKLQTSLSKEDYEALLRDDSTSVEIRFFLFDFFRKHF